MTTRRIYPYSLLLTRCLYGVMFLGAQAVAANALPVESQFRIIALTGDLAADTGGRRFQSFSTPSLNDRGEVAFGATLECCTPRGTIFSNGSGSLKLIAWEDSPAQQGGASTFNSFRNVQIDNLGRTLIRAEMSSLPAEFDAVWVGEANEQLTQIAVSGQPIDPSDPTSTYHSVGIPHLGGGGILAARAQSITNGQRAAGSDVLFKSDGTQLAQPLLRAGDQIATLHQGIVVSPFSPFDNPVVNNNGQIVVRVESEDTQDPTGESFAKHLLLFEPDGTYAPLVSIGLSFGELSLPVLNDLGELAYGANGDIWHKPSGAPAEMVVAVGNDAPGMPDVHFDDLFFDPTSEMPIWVSNRGEVAFWASLVGTPLGNDFAESVWIGSPGNLRPVVVERTDAPGVNGQFNSMPNTIGDLVSEMAVNNNSQVALMAGVEINPGERRFGIFATDLQGELQKIVFFGDEVEVAPGDFRIVDNINFSGDHQAVRGTGFNDQGEIAFSVRFQDGTEALLVSSVVAIPEPASCVLLFQLVAICVSRRSRIRRTAKQE